jgi:hypothetical protein
MTHETAEALAIKKMAMVDLMTQHAVKVCGGCMRDWLDLVVASPGIVISLYITAHECIAAADVPEEDKAETHRLIQMQVEKLLVLVLNAVRSADPKLAMLSQAVTLEEAIRMGPTMSDEVH